MKANNNSITMFLFVVFVIMSGPLWAQFTGGLGTQASPYLVETAEQLHQVRLYPTAYFLQNADINLDLAPYNSGPGWQAIGEPDTPFSGNFDGNGYQIAGLYINRPQADYQGLFGYISNAALLNMQLSDAQIVGNDYVAALSGSALTSIIANCSVQAEITGAEITGGLIGSLAMNSQLSHSSALVQISGDFATGALCGYAKGYSEISSCVSRGSVTGNIAAGGLIGILGGSFLSKSYSTAAVSASSSTGGLLGENDTQSTVQECYSIGSVSGVNDVGGLIGRNLDSTVSQSYWNTQSSGLSYSAAGEGRSSQDMSYPFAADTYQNWDFAESWSWDEDYNGGYPYLTWEYTAPLVLDLMVESFSGPTLLGVNLQAAYTLQVINTGEAIIESFEAKLFKQSGELLSSQILGPIQPEEIFSVQLHWTPTAAYEGSVYAVVELEDDINPDDNQSQQIAVIVSDEIQAATIGNEDTTARYPLDFYWKASVFETIYYADELGFNGMIFNLEFYNSFSEELPNMPIKIWLGESSQTELTEAWIPSTQLQLVYDGPVDFPMGENAISITLDSPFSYQSGNLVMLVERPLDENYYGSQNLFYVQSSSTQRSRSYHSDVEVLDLENPNAPGSWISEYPRCTFRFMGQAYQAAPTELSLEYFPDQSRLALSWLPPETGYPLLYKVYRNEEPYAETILPYFEDNELSPGETYSYYVCAVYATGESEPSNVVSQEIEISSPLAYIPDDNFRMAINNELGQGADYQPTIADLESIIYVEAPDQGIVSLEGAQHLINMQGLYLDSNQISELSPISNLTQLQSLDLNYNQISELSPLSNLTLLEILYLTDNQISELDALSNMTLLRALYLNNNQITELGPLSNMTLLERLYLYDNQITELSPVSTLANLQRLYLANNQVSELSPISSLTNLQGLTLSSNQISELSPLVGLSNLQWLSLAYNQINDASPLSSLISLQDLDLSANQISDIWPLAGLSNLNEFDLEANPLSYESMLLSQSWSLPYTASTYEPLSPCYPDPERNGTDIALNSGLFWQANYEYQTAEYEVYLGASPQSLSYLGYGYLMDETGYTFDTTLEPLTEYYWRVKAVEDTTEIWSGMWSFTTGETVLMAEIGVEPAFVYEELNLEESSELQITISNTGNIPLDWESEIIFGRSIRTGQDRTLSISLEPAFGTIAPSSFVNCLLSFSPADTLGTYSYEIQLSSNDPENPLLIVPVEYQVFSPLAYIPDDNFRMAINSELEQPEDYQPTIADLESLNGRLSATSRGIVSLEGAQHLINLPELILHYNQISDLSPLSNLNNLQYLILFYNQISDLGPLSNLSNLQILDLSSNQVSDLSPLSNLSNLEGLSLDYNQISDLGPLSNLSNLLELYLEDNQFSDLSTLANLSNLQYLNLGSNQISDLSTLANLNNLQYLNLGSNQISDLSTLANLSNLNNLILENNIISDISALANLSNLHYLNLKSNQISGLNSLTNLINLGSLNLQNNQISDLGPLSNLNNLDWLWLNENQISDLSPLAGLTNIQELYLLYNQISDI
ncbi:MAG: leucine-rich repeat domain-containing protein, partial [Candidatus Cloacimonetes bacterium]|nr:leucine-rich repeat domain-containing protein [Candidatus Cloacimonadota bacterium]MCK9243210.1 leucine-rich repeat domain-containing protein [Candidatus Cloacimonadota bacterium]